MKLINDPEYLEALTDALRAYTADGDLNYDEMAAIARRLPGTLDPVARDGVAKIVDAYDAATVRYANGDRDVVLSLPDAKYPGVSIKLPFRMSANVRNHVGAMTEEKKRSDENAAILGSLSGAATLCLGSSLFGPEVGVPVCGISVVVFGTVAAATALSKLW